MGTAIRAIIAGLGGGAESLGSSMQQSDAEKKALQRLIMVEQMKEAGKSVWGNAFPGEDEQGPGLFQENKQTGEVRRVETKAQPVAGIPAPSRAIKALTQSSGAENDPTSGGGQAPPAPPIAPDTNPPVAPGAPRTLGGVRPYQKTHFAPAKFRVNGHDVQGFADTEGNYYDASRQRVSGKIEPYAAPQAPVHDVPITTVDSTGRPTVTWANPVTHATTRTDLEKPKSAGEGALDRRAKTFVDLMEQSLPTMEQLAHKVRPAMISAAIAHPTIANLGLSQAEQSYLDAFRNFLAGVMHQESGARLNQDQWRIGTQRFGVVWGDKPETIDQKLKVARQTTEDRRREYSGTGARAPRAQAAPSTAPSASNGFDDLIPAKKP